MKNLKNFAFGLLVAVLAVGFSAFKKADVAKANVATIHYGYNANTGFYELISGMPDEEKCIQDTEQCVVVADSDDGLDPQLTPAEVQELDLQPWSESRPNSAYDF